VRKGELDRVSKKSVVTFYILLSFCSLISVLFCDFPEEMLSGVNAMLAIINISYNLPTPAVIKLHPDAPLVFKALVLIVNVCLDKDGGGGSLAKITTLLKKSYSVLLSSSANSLK
jgi:hypothetical protein